MPDFRCSCAPPSIFVVRKCDEILSFTIAPLRVLFGRYCDLLLRKSSKNPEENELEDILNQVVSIAPPPRSTC